MPQPRAQSPARPEKVQVWQFAEGADRSPEPDHVKTGERSVRE